MGSRGAVSVTSGSFVVVAHDRYCLKAQKKRLSEASSTHHHRVGQQREISENRFTSGTLKNSNFVELVLTPVLKTAIEPSQ